MPPQSTHVRKPCPRIIWTMPGLVYVPQDDEEEDQCGRSQDAHSRASISKRLAAVPVASVDWVQFPSELCSRHICVALRQLPSNRWRRSQCCDLVDQNSSYSQKIQSGIRGDWCAWVVSFEKEVSPSSIQRWACLHFLAQTVFKAL